MTQLRSVLLGITLLLGLTTAAQAKKNPVTMAAEDLKWSEVPESGGVTMAPIVGDPYKTAYQALAKFPAGTAHPLHSHSRDVVVVVVSGNFNYGPEGGPEKKYGAGSFLMIPGGLKHTSGCDAAAPCVIFQEQQGKFDMKVAGATKPAPAPSK